MPPENFPAAVEPKQMEIKMDNVFRLDGRPALKHDASELDRGLKALRKRTEQIKSAMETVRIESVSQRIILAHNLWRILADLEKAGIPKLAIAQNLKLGKHFHPSTKQLYNYALDPEQDPRPSRDALARRLTKAAKKYLHIVEVAARESNRSLDVLLHKLVDGSDFDVSLSEEVRIDENDTYEEISRFLTELGQRIDCKYKLADYYRYITQQQIMFNSHTNNFQGDDLLVPFDSASLQACVWNSRVSILRYGPFVHLYDYSVVEGLDANLCTFDVSNQSCTSEVFQRGFFVYARVFLGHLPIGINGETELCFVSEFHTEIKGDLPDWSDIRLYSYPSPDCLLNSVYVSGHPTMKITPLPHDRLSELEALATQWPTQIHRITPASCAQFLSRNWSDYRLDYSDLEGTSIKFNGIFEGTPESTAPVGSVAQVLDIDLHRLDTENRMDRILERETKKFLDAADRHRTAAFGNVENRRRAVLRDWENRTL